MSIKFKNGNVEMPIEMVEKIVEEAYKEGVADAHEAWADEGKQPLHFVLDKMWKESLAKNQSLCIDHGQFEKTDTK